MFFITIQGRKAVGIIMPKKDNDYNQRVSFQKDNLEDKGKTVNQIEGHNVRKAALGPNVRRNLR